MALSGRYRFSKDLRLRRRWEFLKVQRGGRRRRGRALVVIGLKREDGPARLGVTVSRKVGNAVVRNRVKRLIREAFRLHQHQLPTSWDLVVVARRAARGATFSEIEKELLQFVRSLESTRGHGR